MLTSQSLLRTSAHRNIATYDWDNDGVETCTEAFDMRTRGLRAVESELVRSFGNLTLIHLLHTGRSQLMSDVALLRQAWKDQHGQCNASICMHRYVSGATRQH